MKKALFKLSIAIGLGLSLGGTVNAMEDTNNILEIFLGTQSTLEVPNNQEVPNKNIDNPEIITLNMVVNTDLNQNPENNPEIIPEQQNPTYTPQPPNGSTNQEPMILLTMSNDNQYPHNPTPALSLGCGAVGISLIAISALLATHLIAQASVNNCTVKKICLALCNAAWFNKILRISNTDEFFVKIAKKVTTAENFLRKAKWFNFLYKKLYRSGQPTQKILHFVYLSECFLAATSGAAGTIFLSLALILGLKKISTK